MFWKKLLVVVEVEEEFSVEEYLNYNFVGSVYMYCVSGASDPGVYFLIFPNGCFDQRSRSKNKRP